MEFFFNISKVFFSYLRPIQDAEDYPPGLEEALSNAYYGHIRGKRTVNVHPTHVNIFVLPCSFNMTCPVANYWLIRHLDWLINVPSIYK